MSEPRSHVTPVECECIAPTVVVAVTVVAALVSVVYVISYYQKKKQNRWELTLSRTNNDSVRVWVFGVASVCFCCRQCEVVSESADVDMQPLTITSYCPEFHHSRIDTCLRSRTRSHSLFCTRLLHSALSPSLLLLSSICVRVCLCVCLSLCEYVSRSNTPFLSLWKQQHGSRVWRRLAAVADQTIQQLHITLQLLRLKHVQHSWWRAQTCVPLSWQYS